MTERLVRDETAVQFFREQLEQAMEHQKVSTSQFTQYYLVNLLAGVVRGHVPPAETGYDDTPLALLYVRAIQSSRRDRAKLLRAMGDTALFVSGFFADSLGGRLVDLDYYKAMGGFAYARLARDEDPRVFGPEVFSELSGRFTQFADLLSEISEKSQVATDKSVLRLYERWIQTGSRRVAALLAERGITPVNPGDLRPQ
ncbi:MAG TPA: hypothetical protein VGQ33_06355 [Vicinamibacteria bacterium]|jgi:hypothetical protein|nr:hypothetical protein [Vicinamibacteria bacterium]